MRYTYYPLSNLPRALDIVWCNFPYDGVISRPGPKPRPALVRAFSLSPEHDRALVEVAYGTSKKSVDSNPLDLHIVNLSEMNKMGLPQATCFVLDHTLWLPWCREFFGQREDGTGPVIGSLTHDARAQLAALHVQRRTR